MNSRQKIENYVRANGKSVGGAVFLALALGPLGLMYASLTGGFMMFLAIAAASFVSPTAGVTVGIGAWVLSIPLAGVIAADVNRGLRAKADLMASFSQREN